MKDKYTFNLTSGAIAPALLRFSLPFLGSSILQFLYGVVDMVVVGRFSDSAGIAAVNNSSQIMQLVTSLVCGIATGGTVLIGQYIGYLGTNIDPEKNKLRGEEVILSDEGAKVVTMVVPTNEELAIARETVRLLNR